MTPAGKTVVQPLSLAVFIGKPKYLLYRLTVWAQSLNTCFPLSLAGLETQSDLGKSCLAQCWRMQPLILSHTHKSVKYERLNLPYISCV